MSIPLKTITKRINKFQLACFDLFDEVVKFSSQTTTEDFMCYCIGKLILNWKTIFPQHHLEFCYEIEEYIDDLEKLDLVLCQNDSFWKKSQVCHKMMAPIRTNQFMKYFTPLMIDFFDTFGLSRYKNTINMNVWYEMLKQLIHFHSLMKQMIEKNNQEIKISKYVIEDRMVLEIISYDLDPSNQKIIAQQKTKIKIDL